MARAGVTEGRASERLDSVRCLLRINRYDSSIILARSLFELAVNLAFISQDVAHRLPEYLKHGGIPITEEEAVELERRFREGQVQAKDIVPQRTWKSLWEMCCKLGDEWRKDYEAFYPYASISAHAGSFTLGSGFLRLLQQQPLSDHDKAAILATALDFHLRITQAAAGVFPDHIQLETAKALMYECRELGQALKSQQ